MSILIYIGRLWFQGRTKNKDMTEGIFTVKFSCYLFRLSMMTFNNKKKKKKNDWAKFLGLSVTILAIEP